MTVDISALLNLPETPEDVPSYLQQMMPALVQALKEKDTLLFHPGGDVDMDLWTIGVTGAPTGFWDESKNAVSQNVGLSITAVAPETPAANTLYSDNIPKAWAVFDGSAGAAAELDDFNMVSLNEQATGHWTYSIQKDMAGANHSIIANAGFAAAGYIMAPLSLNVARVTLKNVRSDTQALVGVNRVSFAVFGDQ